MTDISRSRHAHASASGTRTGTVNETLVDLGDMLGPDANRAEVTVEMAVPYRMMPLIAPSGVRSNTRMNTEQARVQRLQLPLRRSRRASTPP